MILNVYEFILEELHQRIDTFGHHVIISQIEVLLNYANRFYDRQFFTRKAVNNDLLARLEQQLEDYFNGDKSLVKELPTVNALAENLNVTPRYLSDLLRNLLGLNTQQFIHEKVMAKAKEYLAKDDLTIAEVAYHLGFEHPQSFNKLFKSKTNLSPSAYKKSVLN